MARLDDVPFDELVSILDRVADNRDDDTPRLILADWLQEHDVEHYPQMIRYSCELARLKDTAETHERCVELRYALHETTPKCAPRDVWEYAYDSDAPNRHIPRVLRGFAEYNKIKAVWTSATDLPTNRDHTRAYWMTGRRFDFGSSRSVNDCLSALDTPEYRRAGMLFFRAAFSGSPVKNRSRFLDFLYRSPVVPRLWGFGYGYERDWPDLPTVLEAMAARGTRLEQLKVPYLEVTRRLLAAFCRPQFAVLDTLVYHTSSCTADVDVDVLDIKRVLFDSYLPPETKLGLVDINRELFRQVLRADYNARPGVYHELLRGRHVVNVVDQLGEQPRSHERLFATLFPRRPFG